MKRYLIVASLLCPLMASAQTDTIPTVLTLEECRHLAVANNAAVRIADADARAAQEVADEAFTKYFPQVSAQAMAFATDKPVIDFDVMHLFNLQMIRHGVSAGITAVQPVFAGGRIINGNRLARVGVEAGRLQHDKAVDRAALTAEEDYWQIVTLKSKKSTLQSVIALVDTLEYQVQVAVDAGVVTRNDLLKVQLRQNELKSMMVDLDNGIALASNLLAQHIGMDGRRIDVADTLAPEQMPDYPLDLYVDPAIALPQTTDYQLLDQSVKAAELRRDMVRGENMPTVGVGAGYFYDDVVNRGHGFGAVFVSVNVPISGWWGGSHAMAKSRIDLDNARTQRDDLSQMLILNMQNTWDNLTAAHRKMDISRKAINQATENLRINENYYRVGVSTVTDLLDAQMLYRQSLDAYTEAYGNFRVALARYLDATGR